MRNVFKSVYCFCCLFVLLSCVEDVDFSQAENIQLNPVVESNMVFFTIPADKFSDANNNPIAVVQDYTDVEIFQDDFVVDNLTKAEMLFEFSNSISRNFGLFVEFLDEVDGQLHSFTVVVASGEPNNISVTNHTETFEGTSLDNLKLTRKVRVTATMSSPTTHLVNETGNITLRSKGTFYVNVNTGE